MEGGRENERERNRVGMCVVVSHVLIEVCVFVGEMSWVSALEEVVCVCMCWIDCV